MNEILSLTGPLLLMAVLNGIGLLIKKYPFIENKWIPLILPAIGAIIYPLSEPPEKPVFYHYVNDMMRGILVGLGAVGINQLYRQHFGGETKTPADTEKTNLP